MKWGFYGVIDRQITIFLIIVSIFRKEEK